MKKDFRKKVIEYRNNKDTDIYKLSKNNRKIAFNELYKRCQYYYALFRF